MAGLAAVFARDVATVYAYCNESVALASEHGFAQRAAFGKILQGWADAQKGEATRGIAHIRDGLAAYEATGARHYTPLFLTLLAEALALAGKIEEALAALDDALAKAAVSGEKGVSAEVHRLRGELTARLPHPDPAKAEDSFRAALVIAREQGTRGYELRAAVSLARLRGEQGRLGKARELLAPPLRLVHRRLRHPRSERGKGAARRTQQRAGTCPRFAPQTGAGGRTASSTIHQHRQPGRQKLALSGAGRRPGHPHQADSVERQQQQVQRTGGSHTSAP